MSTNKQQHHHRLAAPLRLTPLCSTSPRFASAIGSLRTALSLSLPPSLFLSLSSSLSCHIFKLQYHQPVLSPSEVISFVKSLTGAQNTVIGLKSERVPININSIELSFFASPLSTLRLMLISAINLNTAPQMSFLHSYCTSVALCRWLDCHGRFKVEVTGLNKAQVVFIDSD